MPIDSNLFQGSYALAAYILTAIHVQQLFRIILLLPAVLCGSSSSGVVRNM